jgi:uncharacterized cupin superfamily protein
MNAEVEEVVKGDGYAVGNIDAMGDGPGFRKVRRQLDVTAFGINVIVMPAGYQSGRHYHDVQEEIYFIHKGTVEFSFGDGSAHVLGPGGVARVDAATVRSMRNAGEGDAIYLAAGGKDGYVGRDAHLADGDDRASESASAHPPGA